MNSVLKQHRSPKKRELVGMPIPVFLSLLFYIGTLAATQTVYAKPFMALRWVALGILTLVSFTCWLLGRIPKRVDSDYRSDPSIVFLYLGATLLTVTTAENFKFSGLRWATQGMLILSCMIFLRGTFDPDRLKDLSTPLKVLSLTLLLFSFFFPALLDIYESPYFRGAMGDSNSLGHVSAICALVFLFGAITAEKKSQRFLQFCITVFSVIILFRTGARSSMMAFLAGFFLINYYFGLTRSLLAKSVAFLLVAFILASPMLQSKVIHLVTKEERNDEKPSFILTLKRYSQFGYWPESLFATRERLWSESWDGFLERPIFGWGFGGNSNIPREWSIRPTGVTISRDITNDFLFILEGTGVVGFLAYLGLIFSILKQSPTVPELAMLRNRFRRRGRWLPQELMAYIRVSKKTFPARLGTDGGENQTGHNPLEDFRLARAYVHAQMYILSVSLFVLFLFDGSAFSAGSFISAIFWISAGMASLTRLESVASERAEEKMLKGFKGSRVQGTI